jgi:3-oxoacyl-[acyl-carrier protein] reductase
MTQELTGRTALVPGSTGGLGRASAEALAAMGANVVIVGRRADLATDVAAGLPSAVGIGADITTAAGTDAAVAAAEERFGRVDILVLNGGGPPRANAADFDEAAGQGAIDQLLRPHLRLTHRLLPAMRAAGWGRVVAIGSTGVQQPIDGLVASNVGRAALAGYLKTLATEVAPDGVTVNMVLPGRIATDRVSGVDAAAAAKQGLAVEEVVRRSQATIPVGRYGRPEEFGAVVAFLASPAASYVTGEQIRCDGGLVRHH